MAKKYYAVKIGKKPGVYETWDECKDMVFKYPGAIYKSFETLEEAVLFSGVTSEMISKDKTSFFKTINEATNDDVYAFVDGSFNIATKVYGYGGFLVVNGQKHILKGCGNDKEMASMRNVAGEVLGAMEAIRLAINFGVKELYVYYDYLGIEMWALGEWKRNKKGTIEYYNFFQSIKDKINVKFVKVKGHSGVLGNEEADKLAKEAVGINTL